MGFVSPAPVSLPYVQVVEVLGPGTTTVLGPQDHAPAITLITGIDLCNHDFAESEIAQVQYVSSLGFVVTFFQGQVYAQSQGVFSWRGELPVFTSDSIQVFVPAGRFGVALWGAIIPAATLQP